MRKAQARRAGRAAPGRRSCHVGPGCVCASATRPELRPPHTRLSACPSSVPKAVSAPTRTQGEDQHSHEGEAGMDMRTRGMRGGAVGPTRTGGLPLPCCYGRRGLGRPAPPCTILHDTHSSMCSSPTGPVPLCAQRAVMLRDGADPWPPGSAEPAFCHTPYMAPAWRIHGLENAGHASATPFSPRRDRTQPHTVLSPSGVPTCSSIPGELRNADPHGPRPWGDTQLEDPWQQPLAPSPGPRWPPGNSHFR